MYFLLRKNISVTTIPFSEYCLHKQVEQFDKRVQYECYRNLALNHLRIGEESGKGKNQEPTPIQL